MDKTTTLKPFLKWAGGKRKLVSEIQKHFPSKINRYYEPFLGAGAVFLRTEAQEYFLSDINPDLINCWEALASSIALNYFDQVFAYYFEKRFSNHSEETYYQARELHNSFESKNLSSLERAVLFLYLNKGGFNGLCRYNQKGEFNVPWNKSDKAIDLDKDNLFKVCQHLQRERYYVSRTHLVACNFNRAFESLERTGIPPSSGDVVYLDPPYVPVSSTAKFTEYFGEKFDHTKQRELAHHAIACARNGAKVVASNSNTNSVRSLYPEKYFDIHEIQANRAIASRGDCRQPVTELLIVSK